MSEPPSKKHRWAGPGLPHIKVAYMQLGLLWILNRSGNHTLWFYDYNTVSCPGVGILWHIFASSGFYNLMPQSVFPESWEADKNVLFRAGCSTVTDSKYPDNP